MYNKEQKQRYLDYCRTIYDEKTVRNLESKLSVCDWIEEELGKDISLFTKYEIDDYFYSIGVKSTPASLASTASYFSKYTAWCITNSLVPSGINHFDELVGDNKFDKYINNRISRQKYITRRDLEDMIKMLRNPRDQFVICALYEFGLSRNQEEIMNIRAADINTKKKTVHLISGREPSVSPLFINIANNAANTFEYVTETQNRGEKVYTLEPTDLCYKNAVRITPESKNNNQKMFKLLNQVKKYTGLNESVTANSIADSGMFMYITSNAEQLGISPQEYIKTHNEDLIRQYNKNSIKATIAYKKMADLF